MQIARRTDYAIHFIADLANNNERPLGLRTLAQQQGVSYAFARTVQQGLLKAGIIKAARGANGGIRLARSLGEITLLEVFEAVQDPLDKAFSTKNSPWCNCDGSCVSHDLWLSIQKTLGEHLSAVSLHHILKAQ